ncbi:MAG: hypothetical protein HFJ84_11235 [Clostridiales bacterium]|jgi:hypothetical protein|nr:hypothetical protein [Clostridiales bacterium]
MSQIKAGVVFCTKFVTSSEKAYSGYVRYIDREEATRNEAFQKYSAFQFSGYNDYMGNPEKTTALFTSNQDSLSDMGKKELKDSFTTAQKNGSPMWQHIISFDNRWLEENGLYDSSTHTLNEIKMKEVVRASMNSLLKKERMEGTAIWSGSIHYNTDNIHVHIAMVEPFPTRKTKINEQGKPEVRGKMKQSSIESAKSSIVNHILGQQPEIQMIHQLRDSILKKRKDIHLMDDKKLADKIQQLYQALPENKQFWNYNSNSIHDLKPLIDSITSDYLETYQKEDFEAYKKLLQTQEKKYKTAYGNPKDGNHYAENKIQDLYTRLGNSILRELKEFDKQQKQEFYRHAKAKQNYPRRPNTGNAKNPHGSSSSNSRPTASNQSQYRQNPAYHPPEPKTQLSFVPTQLYPSKFDRKHTVCHQQFLQDLKKALKSDLENARNQAIYQQMEKEKEQKANEPANGDDFNF